MGGGYSSRCFNDYIGGELKMSRIEKCKICGKIDFDNAHDTQGSCVVATTFSPAVGDWRCMATMVGVGKGTVKSENKSVIRKIIPGILDVLKPGVVKVTKCVLFLSSTTCNLELCTELLTGHVEVVTIRMGDNSGFKTCLIARYIDGLLDSSFVLEPTWDVGYFKTAVLEHVALLRD